jgi:hypothetical protein
VTVLASHPPICSFLSHLEATTSPPGSKSEPPLALSRWPRVGNDSIPGPACLPPALLTSKDIHGPPSGHPHKATLSAPRVLLKSMWQSCRSLQWNLTSEPGPPLSRVTGFHGWFLAASATHDDGYIHVSVPSLHDVQITRVIHFHCMNVT